MLKKIGLGLISIIVLIFLIGMVYIDERHISQDDYNSLNTKEICTVNKVYLLCRGPISGTDMIYNHLTKYNYTTNNSDTQFEHHHYFLVDDIFKENESQDVNISQNFNLLNLIAEYEKALSDINIFMKNKNIKIISKESTNDDNQFIVGIEDSCEKNNFNNFVFFKNGKIKCDENINNYSECHVIAFDEKEIRKAINILRTDNLEYNLFRGIQKKAYNCQTFAKDIIKTLDKVKTSENDIMAIEKMCMMENNILSLLDAKNQKSNFEYKWIENPFKTTKELNN